MSARIIPREEPENDEYEVIGFAATTSVNRKDFGLEWNVARKTDGFLVGDEITIALDIQAAKQG